MKKTIMISLAIAGIMQVTPSSVKANASTSANKDSVNNYLSMARSEQAARRYSNAWSYFEKASKIDANNADAQKGIADVCIQMNRMGPGIAALDRYYALRPADNEALVQLTKLYFNYGTWTKVMELAPKMHQRVPSENGWAYMLGKSYFSIQNYGKGLEYLQAAVKLDENNAEALYLIGHIYTLMSNYGAGIPYYRKSLAIDSITSNHQRLYEFALVLSTASQFEESIAVFQKALDKGYRARDDFYMNLAYTLADAHQTDRAVRMLDDMLQRRPSDLGIIEALADVCYHSGKYSQAIAYYDKMMEIDSKNARALYSIGLSYIKMGKDSDGHALCDKAIAMDPSLASLRHQKSGLF